MAGSSGGCTVHVWKPRERKGHERKSQRGAMPHWNVRSLAKYKAARGVSWPILSTKVAGEFHASFRSWMTAVVRMDTYLEAGVFCLGRISTNLAQDLTRRSLLVSP